MFNRIYNEFQFQTLRLTDFNENLTNFNQTTSNNKSNLVNCVQEGHIENIIQSSTSTENLEENLKFTDTIKNYDEKFIMISQGHNKSLFIDLRLNELIQIFSVPICARFDGKTKCSKDCECKTSVDIGNCLYDKGGVHSFHQIGNYIIGSIVEQQSDPLTRIAIKFDSTMQNIKIIYCPCKLYFCPHVVALLFFRIKLKNFYAIKLPLEMFHKNISQTELIKFYGFFVEESRSLPIIKDYHSTSWSYEQCLKQNHLQIPYIYAYCHKNLLPIDYAILEEQTRARRWIRDLYMKRNSQSLSCMTPLPNAGEIFLCHDTSSSSSSLHDSSSSSSSTTNRLKNINSKSSLNNKNKNFN